MRRRIDPIPELKRQMAEEILLLTAGWTQTHAAFFMHVSQSRISELRRGNLTNMSLEKLLKCLTYFSHEIEIRTNRTTFRAKVYPPVTLAPPKYARGRRGGSAPEREDPEPDNRP